nr:hypothetical protein [Phycisphaerales bacterium]
MSTNGHGNRAPRGWRGVAIQVVGLAVGLALLGWCVSVALRPENRDQLGRLREAPPWMIAGVVGLSAG